MSFIFCSVKKAIKDGNTYTSFVINENGKEYTVSRTQLLDLYANGYRFSGIDLTKKGIKILSSVVKIEELKKPKKPITNTKNSVLDKELLAKLLKQDGESDRFIREIVKDTYNIIPLRDRYIRIEKSSIETRFCANATQNSENARNYLKGIKNDKDIFINENIKKSRNGQNLNKLLEEQNKVVIYYIPTYRSKNFYNICVKYRDYCTMEDIKRDNGMFLTDEEISMYINYLKGEQKDFVKRLETYWKKYQGTKLYIWTYLDN